MALLPISKLVPGMIITQDVKDINGRLLISSGAAVNERILKVFKMWGVRDVEIQDDETSDLQGEENTAVQIDPEKLEELKAEVAGLLRFNDFQHPFLDNLMQICLQKKIEALAGKNDE